MIRTTTSIYCFLLFLSQNSVIHSFGICSKRTFIHRATRVTNYAIKFGGPVIPEAEPLRPESDPNFENSKTDVRSVSGISYKIVHDWIETIYPSNELDKRNSVSRIDGYWPYVQSGKDVPKQYTYGEFDFYFFAQLLDTCATNYLKVDSLKDKVFVDIGSGTGRLVVSAAALHPSLRLSRGIEILPSITQIGQDIVNTITIPQQQPATTNYSEGVNAYDRNKSSIDNEQNIVNKSDNTNAPQQLAPIDLVCGSFEDPYVHFGDADIIFVFSSCMGSDIVSKLTTSIGRQCKIGAIVITTDTPLNPLQGMVPPDSKDDRVPFGSYEFELLDTIDGYSWLMGGSSTVYIHRVVMSANNGIGIPERIDRPIPTVEDIAFDVAMQYDAGTLTDTKAFIRGVYNNMVFANIPSRFWPQSMMGQQ